MGRKLFVAIASLTLSACVSTPRPVTQLPAPGPSQADSEEYIRSLQEAWDAIGRRSSAATANPSIVDAEAARSIPIPDHPSIDGALRYFRNSLRESIQQSLTRSGGYKEMIDATLDEHGVPRAFAYLPVIESGYAPELTSRAGARGIWQFMTETARAHQLRVDWWVDERSDPEKSTRAAAQYLSELYSEFGDWPLTLAAYNCGPGRVRRALERHHATTFWELLEKSALPKETRGYVPTFYATLLIVSDPEAHGFRLQNPLALETRVVEVEGPVSLDFVATVANVDPKQIRSLNPELRQGMTPPWRYPLRVLPETAGPIMSRAATMKDEDPVIALARFTLRRGDTVATLATQIDIKADEILAMNGIRSARVGQTIYLPLRQQDLSARLQAEKFHIVRKGDTLYSIAKAYELSVAELRDMNQLSRKHVIRAGERLRVRGRLGVIAGN